MIQFLKIRGFQVGRVEMTRSDQENARGTGIWRTASKKPQKGLRREKNREKP
jgi:hypothetical protein